MRQTYPSDITREQFELIRYMLESAKKVTHPRVTDLYDIFCAVLYLLKGYYPAIARRGKNQVHCKRN